MFQGKYPTGRLRANIPQDVSGQISHGTTWGKYPKGRGKYPMGRFRANIPQDVSGQISHRTFQGKYPTGRFGADIPEDASDSLRKTPEISGNFAAT